jgi:hypothetical protein
MDFCFRCRHGASEACTQLSSLTALFLVILDFSFSSAENGVQRFLQHQGTIAPTGAPEMATAAPSITSAPSVFLPQLSSN